MTPTSGKKSATSSERVTPYGNVEDLYIGGQLRAWRIHKDAEELEPAPQVCSRDDLLYVVEGTLRLELDDRQPVDVATGELFVIPAGTRYRGYRWPRDGGPCTFVAVTPADATFETAA
jgi:mannose-6-phosphate isomerase-like protein (cupin superfamily)